MILKRRTLAFLAACALWAPLAGPALGQTVPDYYPDDYSEVIEASRGEGSLLVYSNSSRTQWEPFISVMAEQYPWITIEVLDINSGELVERYLAESLTGTRTADLLVHQSLEGWINLRNRDALAEYTSAEDSMLPGYADQGGGIYVMGVDTTSFVWNKLLLSDDLVPENLGDLVEKIEANPGLFQGAIVTYGPSMSAAGFTNHYSYLAARGEDGWETLAGIGPSVRVESSAGPMLEKLLAGEYVLGYFIATASIQNRLADPGVDQLLGTKLGSPEDGVPMISRSAAITRAAASPNSARLFMDLLLSQEGQIALARGNLPYLRDDITSDDIGGLPTVADAVAEIGEENLLLAPVENEVVEQREALLARLAEIYGTL